MKIIYLSPHPHINMAAPSGPGTHIREVIKGFEKSGHTVIKLIAGGTELNTSSSIVFKKRSWKKFIPNFLWETLRDFSLLRTDKNLESQLIALIQKEKPDMIYERAYYLMGAGFRAAQATGVRYSCEINAPYPEEKAIMNGKSLLNQKARHNEVQQVKFAHRVFVVSTALKKYLEKNCGCEQRKIVVTPNAVNLAGIQLSDEKQEQIRKQFGILRSDQVIGFVGSIFAYHGVDVLIEAFARLVQDRQEPLKLLIVGDGEILNKLKERVSSLGISGQVSFTGNVAHHDVYNYIQIMNYTVMARSNWYGSPVKIFEYGALKKCVIAPEVVPVLDVMIDKKDGLLVKDNDGSLQDALLYLLDHPEDAQRMAESFYQKVISRHTWQQVSDTILEEMK